MAAGRQGRRARSSRPASATRSAPASWRRSMGPRPRARRPGRLRARGVRRRDGRHPGVLLHRRASSSSRFEESYGDDAADRGRARTSSLTGSAVGAAGPRPRSAGTPSSAASSPTYSCPRIRHHAGMSTPRPRVVGDAPRSCRRPATSREVPGQLDDRQRAAHARGSRARSGPRSQAATSRAQPLDHARAARPGSGRRRPRSCRGSARPARCRGSARPSRPARGSARGVEAVHAEPLATANPRRSSSVTSASPST